MIALTDDNWATSNLAIGLFTDENGKKHTGVNVDVLAGKAVIGNNLWIENPKLDENGAPTGIMQFKVDSSGAWLNNSTFVLQSDAGGQLLLHPDYGFAAGDGTSKLFTTNGTNVVPSFIDDAGNLILDDGFPKNANFYIDSRTGDIYLRGKVVATSGEFKGVVKAEDFQLWNGKGMASILKKVDGQQDKITADWLDLFGINVKNNAGDTVLRIDENGIRFAGSGNCQFSKSANGPWHFPMEAGDEYRHDFVRFGDQDTIEWGPAYRIVGRNGANGSDANVTRANIERALAYASTLGSSYIAIDSMGSPVIYGGQIFGSEIYAGGAYENGSFKGTGSVISLTSDGMIIKDSNSFTTLQIGPVKLSDAVGTVSQIYGGYEGLSLNARAVYIGYSHGTSLRKGMAFEGGETNFYGDVTFNGNVYGVTARFG